VEGFSLTDVEVRCWGEWRPEARVGDDPSSVAAVMVDSAVNATLAANKPRTSWTLRELAFKSKTPSRTPSTLELKLPDE
jgi:hypothetical protein